MQRNLNQNVSQGEPGPGERLTDNVMQLYPFIQVGNIYLLFDRAAKRVQNLKKPQEATEEKPKKGKNIAVFVAVMFYF